MLGTRATVASQMGLGKRVGVGLCLISSACHSRHLGQVWHIVGVQ